MKNNFSFLHRLLTGAVLFLFATLSLSAQEASQPEKMPEYPGGFEALVKYMTDNIRYPEAAKKEKAEGTIIVKFTVGTDGAVTDISTKNEGEPQRPDLVLEAVRVVKEMPKWTPAQKKGKAVKCEMALPVQFKI